MLLRLGAGGVIVFVTVFIAYVIVNSVARLRTLVVVRISLGLRITLIFSK